MASRVIGAFSSFLCFLPMFLISFAGKKSKEPINFISGDNSLKKKIKDVKAYNHAMAVLFLIWSLCYFCAGILYLFNPLYGTMMLICSCTIVLAMMFIWYKILVKRYS